MPISDFYKNIINEADAFYKDAANAPDYYPANTVAGIDPYQQQALQQQLAAAPGQTLLGQQYADTVSGYAAGTHPALQRLASLSGNAAADAFGTSGTYGSARGYNAANRASADTIYEGQLDAAQLVPRAQEALTAGARTIGNVGDFYNTYNQSVINEDVKRHNYYQQLPGALLSQRLGLGGLYEAGEAGKLGANLSGVNDLFGSSSPFGLDFGGFGNQVGNALLSNYFGIGGSNALAGSIAGGLGDIFDSIL